MIIAANLKIFGCSAFVCLPEEFFIVCYLFNDCLSITSGVSECPIHALFSVYIDLSKWISGYRKREESPQPESLNNKNFTKNHDEPNIKELNNKFNNILLEICKPENLNSSQRGYRNTPVEKNPTINDRRQNLKRRVRQYAGYYHIKTCVMCNHNARFSY